VPDDRLKRTAALREGVMPRSMTRALDGLLDRGR